MNGMDILLKSFGLNIDELKTEAERMLGDAQSVLASIDKRLENIERTLASANQHPTENALASFYTDHPERWDTFERDMHNGEEEIH